MSYGSTDQAIPVAAGRHAHETAVSKTRRALKRLTTQPWSGRRTLLFILGTCGGFWTAVIWLVS